MWVEVSYDWLEVKFTIKDDGIGIFTKIQQDFNLSDKRHSILELAKGKLTSDPLRHSGEGIFFTSRMFDRFVILSEDLTFLDMIMTIGCFLIWNAHFRHPGNDDNRKEGHEICEGSI